MRVVIGQEYFFIQKPEIQLKIVSIDHVKDTVMFFYTKHPSGFHEDEGTIHTWHSGMFPFEQTHEPVTKLRKLLEGV